MTRCALASRPRWPTWSESRPTAQKRVAEVERDRKLLRELEAIRANRSRTLGLEADRRRYAAAFRRFGIDLDRLDPEEAGRRIAQRSEPVELASYLDDWAMVRAGRGREGQGFLVAAARRPPEWPTRNRGAWRCATNSAGLIEPRSSGWPRTGRTLAPSRHRA